MKKQNFNYHIVSSVFLVPQVNSSPSCRQIHENRIECHQVTRPFVGRIQGANLEGSLQAPHGNRSAETPAEDEIRFGSEASVDGFVGGISVICGR